MKKKRLHQANLKFCTGKETERKRKRSDGGERKRKRGDGGERKRKKGVIPISYSNNSRPFIDLITK